MNFQIFSRVWVVAILSIATFPTGVLGQVQGEPATEPRGTSVSQSPPIVEPSEPEEETLSEMVLRARDLALQVHADAPVYDRERGLIYEEHLPHVIRALHAFRIGIGQDNSLVSHDTHATLEAAAWLYATMRGENGLNQSDIEAQFGRDIAELVWAVTPVTEEGNVFNRVTREWETGQVVNIEATHERILEHELGIVLSLVIQLTEVALDYRTLGIKKGVRDAYPRFRRTFFTKIIGPDPRDENFPDRVRSLIPTVQQMWTTLDAFLIEPPQPEQIRGFAGAADLRYAANWFQENYPKIRKRFSSWVYPSFTGDPLCSGAMLGRVIAQAK